MYMKDGNIVISKFNKISSSRLLADKTNHPGDSGVVSSVHCYNLRQHVVGEPYFRGMSAQGQPVFKM
ncbi:hypothetical protein [Laceyella putida]|uniref:Uncharacterized protein n=1 Tax=Laceyella putida TaxID=110101 RepID=A0ABW2RKG6_9BACL